MIGKKNWIATDLGDGRAEVRGNCAFTGEEYVCHVPLKGLEEYLNGVRIHIALSGVSADDREFIISGISPKGWKKTFG
jgi:hypothetical protein